MLFVKTQFSVSQKIQWLNDYHRGNDQYNGNAELEDDKSFSQKGFPGPILICPFKTFAG